MQRRVLIGLPRESFTSQERRKLSWPIFSIQLGTESYARRNHHAQPLHIDPGQTKPQCKFLRHHKATPCRPAMLSLHAALHFLDIEA